MRPKIPKLLYVSDQEPGISRIRRGKGFQYLLPDKTVLTDSDERERVIKLGLPPAYTQVWICAQTNGHIQATGIDNALRKQYRYHDDWRLFRDQQKFDQLAEFAEVLPRIRRKVNRLLNAKGKSEVFGKDVATAALVRLIDRTAIRIGGRSRTSKGATTLDIKNVKYENGRLQLGYRGKGGKRVHCSLRDTRLQKILEVIDDLPGKKLFQYIGDIYGHGYAAVVNPAFVICGFILAHPVVGQPAQSTLSIGARSVSTSHGRLSLADVSFAASLISLTADLVAHLFR